MDRRFQTRPHMCFEVEKVIGISSDGSYQVQWAPAWVSRLHLVGCEHLIHEFLQQQTEKERQVETQLEMSQEEASEADQANDVKSLVIVDTGAAVSELDDATHVYDESLSSHLGMELPPEISTQVGDSQGVQGGVINEINSDNTAAASSLNNIQIDSAAMDIKVEENTASADIQGDPSLSFIPRKEISLSEHMNFERGGISLVEEQPLNPVGNNTLLTDPSADSIQTPYRCHHCNRRFQFKTSLSKHILIHKQSESYKCQVCKKTFPSIFLLKQHRHICSHPYSSPHSDLAFPQHGQLKHHLHKQQTGVKPYTCERCGKGFSTKSSLATHIRIHTGVKPYSCDVCGETFTQLTQRNRHKTLNRCPGIREVNEKSSLPDDRSADTNV